jgi:hypothetical protein
MITVNDVKERKSVAFGGFKKAPAPINGNTVAPVCLDTTKLPLTNQIGWISGWGMCNFRLLMLTL